MRSSAKRPDGDGLLSGSNQLDEALGSYPVQLWNRKKLKSSMLREQGLKERLFSFLPR